MVTSVHRIPVAFTALSAVACASLTGSSVSTPASPASHARELPRSALRATVAAPWTPLILATLSAIVRVMNAVLPGQPNRSRHASLAAIRHNPIIVRSTMIHWPRDSTPGLHVLIQPQGEGKPAA